MSDELNKDEILKEAEQLLKGKHMKENTNDTVDLFDSNLVDEDGPWCNIWTDGGDSSSDEEDCECNHNHRLITINYEFMSLRMPDYVFHALTHAMNKASIKLEDIEEKDKGEKNG
jgi:hypothetical protein